MSDFSVTKLGSFANSYANFVTIDENELIPGVIVAIYHEDRRDPRSELIQLKHELLPIDATTVVKDWLLGHGYASVLKISGYETFRYQGMNHA